MKKVERNNRIYVLTGGPGFGKSMLIDYLHGLGFKTGNEVAREIIREQRSAGGSILPEKDIRSFQKEVLKRRLAFYKSVVDGEVAFSDRAIPDQIAFARFNGYGTPDALVQHAVKFRYNKKVFVTPPWKEIYQNDEERAESFEKACELHQKIVEVYEEFNYALIELPCTDIKQRAEFVLNLIY